MHAMGKNSLSSDKVGLGEANEGVREAVECPVAGAFPAPTFLSTDLLHLRYSDYQIETKD